VSLLFFVFTRGFAVVRFVFEIAHKCLFQVRQGPLPFLQRISDPNKYALSVAKFQ
jgi:hypothetical protein